MRGLNVIRVIVPSGAAEALRFLVVWHNVSRIRKRLVANPADVLLLFDFPLYQPSHGRWRPSFPVSPWMMFIRDSGYTRLKARIDSVSTCWDCNERFALFTAAAVAPAVDPAEFIGRKFHGFSFVSSSEGRAATGLDASDSSTFHSSMSMRCLCVGVISERSCSANFSDEHTPITVSSGYFPVLAMMTSHTRAEGRGQHVLQIVPSMATSPM